MQIYARPWACQGGLHDATSTSANGGMQSERCTSAHPCMRAVAGLFASGCARSWTQQSRRPTCVVLSAGGAAGVAHVGALEAVTAENLRVDCITGTSMGALVGSLYAAAPHKSVRAQYQQLISQYRSATEGEVGRNALLGGVLGAVVAGIATGGASTLPLILGASSGAAAAAQATPAIDLDRFTKVLARFHNGTTIESLAVPYATFYHERQDTGLRLVVVRQGAVATAVARSVANPFIFENFNPVAAGYVDPGSDRLAAVPVEDTCKLFPDARILAINASGEAAVHSEHMKCPLLQVQISVEAVGLQALAGDNEDFMKAAKLGFEATQMTLRQDAARR